MRLIETYSIKGPDGEPVHQECIWTLIEMRSPDDKGCEGCGGDHGPVTWTALVPYPDEPKKQTLEEYCGTCASHFLFQFVFTEHDFKVEL